MTWHSYAYGFAVGIAFFSFFFSVLPYPLVPLSSTSRSPLSLSLSRPNPPRPDPAAAPTTAASHATGPGLDPRRRRARPRPRPASPPPAPAAPVAAPVPAFGPGYGPDGPARLRPPSPRPPLTPAVPRLRPAAPARPTSSPRRGLPSKAGEGDDAGIRLFAQVVLGQEINGARVVTLNRPHQLNGINDRVVYLLAQLLEKWEKNDDAKLVIFKGAGRAFSAGGDLKMFYEGRSSDDSCLDMMDIMPNDLGLDGDAVQPDYDDHRTRCLLHRSSGRR